LHNTGKIAPVRYFLRWLIRSVINLVAHVEVTGYEYIPSDSNFVIATNHLGILDAPMAFYALDRWDLLVLVAEKWEKIWLFRLLGKYFNFIFIDRFNPDIKALRKVIKLMEEGNNLVIAPEGTRSRVGSLIEGRPGVSYLATRLGRPIVPVALIGTEDKLLFGNLKRLKRTQMKIKAGPSFTLPQLPRENRDQVLQEYTDEIMCRIAAMMPERYWGVYKDHPRLKELLQATQVPGRNTQE
jgi:1-acyl-sn-glycerol-3-phosphate acyltransferase